jgi:ABC-2 type transport system ATP-binding protein
MILAAADRVSKRYHRLTAIDEVTIALAGRQIVGLLGPNGAGKTTLLRMFARLVRPTSGAIDLRGAACRGAIRFFGGERTLPPFVSPREWTGLCGARGSASLPRTVLGVLSRGTRQRLGLETLLAAPGALLLLDEPWEHLDLEASTWLSRRLLDRRDEGAAILIASHRIHELAEICDRCVFLERGRLVFASPCPDEPGAAERARWMLNSYRQTRGQR